jgi:hypothetical protein
MTKDIKKDTQGRYRTQSLFWEMRSSALDPIYTTKDEDIVRDKVTYKSLKKIYMSYDHAPGFEYDFALATLGSWNHWLKLCNNATEEIRVMIKEWRDELDMRIKSQNINAIMVQARDNDAKGLQAAKYLVEKGYTKRAGRPSKEDVDRELKVDAKAAREQQDDMERIGLKLVGAKK